MARVSARPRPERERVLTPVRHDCPECGVHMRLRYDNRRNLVTFSGPMRLRLRIRRCEAPDCRRFHVPYRPEAECALALPRHEFGPDVVALIGLLSHREHRSVPEIHAALRGRGMEIAERSVTNLLDRYDELLAASLTGTRRLRRGHRSLIAGWVVKPSVQRLSGDGCPCRVMGLSAVGVSRRMMVSEAPAS
jgi:hypothetical protein